MNDQFFKRLSSFFKGDGSANGQRSNLLIVALIALGIFFMFISANPPKNNDTGPPPESVEVISTSGGRSDFKERLEKELSDRLRRVKGVSDVSVLITLETGPGYQYAESKQTTERTTNEDDGAGGLRQIEERTVNTQPVISRKNNGDEPVIVVETQPKIAGVLVVAKGADNPHIEAQITNAVAAALNVPSHRIRILPME